MSEGLPVYPELLDRDDLSVLVVDGGGRGDALDWKLEQSSIIKDVVQVDYIDTKSIVRLAQDKKFDLVVVGKDKAIADGLVNELALRSIAAYGPTRQSGKIEWYKPKAKRMARQLGIPTPDFKVFKNAEQAGWHIDRRAVPMAMKAVGLTRAKAVKVSETRKEAHEFIDKVMVRRIYGNAGDEVIIEDALDPRYNIEVSMHDAVGYNSKGKLVVLPFISSQDYKQVNDGDKGPNTGGMGTIAPVSWLPQDKINELSNQFTKPMAEALMKNGEPYRGVLYTGLMGRYLLEYNARFGDPEAQVYMRLLKTDLGRLMVASLNNQLDQIELEWEDKHAICVVASHKDYPEKNKFESLEIHGLETASMFEGIKIFHAATSLEDGRLYTNGGRVLNITATGDTPEQAFERVYNAIQYIHFGSSDGRTDIGKRPAPNLL